MFSLTLRFISYTFSVLIAFVSILFLGLLIYHLYSICGSRHCCSSNGDALFCGDISAVDTWYNGHFVAWSNYVDMC